MTKARQQLGEAGERQAERWYVREGYAVVARNWRCTHGEVDLVLRRRRLLVFVEVKTRRSDAFGVPAEAVTPVKQARIRRIARSFVDELGWRPSRCRFDVASILAGDLEVLENCF